MIKILSVSLVLLFCTAVGANLKAWAPSDSIKNAMAKAQSAQQKADLYNLLGLESYRNNPNSATFFIGEALNISRQIGYEHGEAEYYRINGLIKHNKGFYQESLKEFETATGLFRILGDSNKVGMVYKNVGWVHLELGDFPKALIYFSNAHRMANQYNDLLLKGQVLNNLGVLMALIGEYDSAMVYLLKSVEITKKNGDRILGLTYTNIGLVKSDLGDYESAESYFLKGLELDILHDHDWGVANAFENIGELKLNLGRMNEAQNYFQKARDQFTKLKDVKGVGVNDNFLGVILYNKREYEAAYNKLNHAYKLYEEINYKRGLAKVLRDMANCKILIGDHQSAVRLAKTSLNIAREIGQIPEAVQTAEILHRLYADLGDIKNAYNQAVIYLAYKDSLYNHEKIEYVAQLEAKHRLTQIQQENEILVKDNQLKINELQASNLQIERQHAIQFALLLCLFCALLTAFFWYRFNLRKQNTIKLLRKLNEEIHHQKEQIVSQADELENVNAEMANMNSSLEVLVEERTKKIESQNQKLREYAFSNSHEVRAPLTNLLGLVNITKLDGLTSQEQDDIIEKIYVSALDLDQVITKVNKVLEEEGL